MSDAGIDSPDHSDQGIYDPDNEELNEGIEG